MHFSLCHEGDALDKLLAVLTKHRAEHLYDEYESLLFHIGKMAPPGTLEIVLDIPGRFAHLWLELRISDNKVPTLLDAEEFLCAC